MSKTERIKTLRCQVARKDLGKDTNNVVLDLLDLLEQQEEKIEFLENEINYLQTEMRRLSNEL